MARHPALAVVDASVVVKWFKAEEHFREAFALRNDWLDGAVELYAPELLPYEVLNALKYDPAQTNETLKEAATSLLDYQFQIMPFTELNDGLIDNAYRYAITFYDAAYLTAAEKLGVLAYTADEKLLRKVGGSILCHISKYRTGR